MADASDHIAVTIEPDPAPGADGTGDPAVAELQAQFAALKTREARAQDDRTAALRRAQAAETAAQNARTEAATVRTAAVESEAGTITAGIDAANAAVAAAKTEIKTAIEAGDPQAQADAVDRLTEARTRLLRLNEAKTDVETRKTEAARPAPRTETPASTGDQFEDYLSKFTAPTATWMRDHKEWVTDGRKSLKLNAGHSDALSEGLEPDTPAYFAHVEKFIGLTQAAPAAHTNGAAHESPAAKPAARRAPVAPVQANGGSDLNGGSGATVRLSRKQADAATDGTHVWNYDDPSPQKRFRKGEPIGIQEMARRVKAQTEQGLYRAENIEV